MTRPDVLLAPQVNWAQYETGQTAGHYESFYLRANHPDRPQAFWLRYTIFAPAHQPDRAVGELWAVVFDAAAGHVTAKVEVPLPDCVFSPTSFDVRVAGATLDGTGLTGQVGEIGWDLRYETTEPPLYLLPAGLYRGGFPTAKSLVSAPLARFTGTVTVAGATIAVERWTGSQNHNWGSRHTDRYAFGQVAGFDNAPDSFLEVAIARSRIGPLWTPPVTLLVLRHRGREYALTRLSTGLRARASATVDHATFASHAGPIAVTGRIDAPADSFVLLEYANPPGGVKYCLNTKLASCTVVLTDRSTGHHESLYSSHGALYELLDDVDPRSR